VIPHPKKAYKGGEDAYFISSDGNAVGVADGVGGWSDQGVDPSIYAKALMSSACEFYNKNKQNYTSIQPIEILDYAYKQSRKIIGSCTACVIVLDQDQLRTANLGDSGLFVVRKGDVLFQTEPQQYEFNFPYQLGTGSDTTPKDADVTILNVKEGDLIVMGTDGLFDNLFISEIQELIKKNVGDEKDSKKILEQMGSSNLAQVIADQAKIFANSKTRLSPFSRMAKLYGLDFEGGKLDDITVVVSLVTSLPANRSKL